MYFNHRFVPTPDVVPKHVLKYHSISLEFNIPNIEYRLSPVIKNTVLSGISSSLYENLDSSHKSSQTILGLINSCQKFAPHRCKAYHSYLIPVSALLRAESCFFVRRNILI